MRAACRQKRLNICPIDAGSRWTIENRHQNPAMLPSHWLMISLDDIRTHSAESIGGTTVRRRAFHIPAIAIALALCDLAARQPRSGGSPRKLGGDGGARTPNLGIANAALSQLSYVPFRHSAMAPRTSTGYRRVFQPSNGHSEGQRVPLPIPANAERHKSRQPAWLFPDAPDNQRRCPDRVFRVRPIANRAAAASAAKRKSHGPGVTSPV